MYQVTYETAHSTKVVLVSATNSKEAVLQVRTVEAHAILVIDVKSFYGGEVFLISEKING
jgi:hypothetical protein